jgi:hypothetical protein
MKRASGWLIHGPQGESITDGPIWTKHFAAESKANAYFIAAAPATAAERDRLREVNAELVRTLEALLHETELAGNANADDYGWPTVVPQARAALATARGEKVGEP